MQRSFIIVYLRHDAKLPETVVAHFWLILGLASVASPFVWGPILGQLKGGRETVATVSIVTVGAVIPLLWPRPAGACLSAILFGGSFLAVITAVTSFARRTSRPHAWTTAIAAFTIAFGLGQCVGPLLSGVLSDRINGVQAGLWFSTGILLVAIFVALFQPEPVEQRER